jgi:hypothetical protein
VKAGVWRATSWEMTVFECVDGEKPICYDGDDIFHLSKSLLIFSIMDGHGVV